MSLGVRPLVRFCVMGGLLAVACSHESEPQVPDQGSPENTAEECSSRGRVFLPESGECVSPAELPPAPAPVRERVSLVPEALSCERVGPVLRNCVVAPLTLLPEAESLQEFVVEYRFRCNRIHQGMEFRTEKQAIPVQIAENVQTIHLFGKGPLRLFDAAPALTAEAVLLPSCEFSIVNVTGNPVAL